MQPNFNRFRTALLCQGEPDRVPLADASIDKGIKEAVLGRPIRTAQDEVDFWAEAGYDFVPVHCGLRLMTAKNEAPLETAFTVSIEAAEGVTTGISAHDRAHTVQVAIDPDATRLLPPDTEVGIRFTERGVVLIPGS